MIPTNEPKKLEGMKRITMMYDVDMTDYRVSKKFKRWPQHKVSLEVKTMRYELLDTNDSFDSALWGCR